MRSARSATEAAKPSSRMQVRPGPLLESGICAAPVTEKGVPSAAESAPTAAASSRPSITSVASVSGAGSTLKVTSRDDRERAVGAGEELHQVVAGDVLHDAAAGFHHFAAAGDGAHADEAVAGSAARDAARAGEIGGGDGADGRLAGGAVEPAMVGRLEGQALAVFGKQRLDLGKRRAGAGGDHQFGRLVEGDAAHFGGGERPRRPAPGGRGRPACRRPSPPTATCGRRQRQRCRQPRSRRSAEAVRSRPQCSLAGAARRHGSFGSLRPLSNSRRESARKDCPSRQARSVATQLPM